MATPGFTAELSLGPPVRSYLGRSFSNPSISTGISPQLRIGGLGVTNDCCCTTASGKKVCIEGGCESGCACGCSLGTPICVCSVPSPSAAFYSWRI